MKRYAIWDKESQIITPIGEVLTAEQWLERYPVAKLKNVTVLCAAGEINGGYFGTLNGLKERYEAMGADFSDCTTNEEILQKIENFEDELNAGSPIPSDTERIAAALEYQNLVNM